MPLNTLVPTHIYLLRLHPRFLNQHISLVLCRGRGLFLRKGYAVDRVWNIIMYLIIHIADFVTYSLSSEHHIVHYVR